MLTWSSVAHGPEADVRQIFHYENLTPASSSKSCNECFAGNDGDYSPTPPSRSLKDLIKSASGKCGSL
jgi:hypothetical protein